MAARMDRELKRRMAEQGMASLTNQEGLDAFENLLESRLTQAAVIKADWARVFRSMPAAKGEPFFEKLASVPRQTVEKKEASFLDVLDKTGIDRRRSLLLAHIRAELAKILGLHEVMKIDARRGFFDMGMDSLTSVELRNKLQSSLQCTLSTTMAFDYSTIESLSNHIVRDVLPLKFPAEANRAETPGATALSRDHGDAAIEDLLARELAAIAEEKQHG